MKDVAATEQGDGNVERWSQPRIIKEVLKFVRSIAYWTEQAKRWKFAVVQGPLMGALSLPQAREGNEVCSALWTKSSKADLTRKTRFTQFWRWYERVLYAVFPLFEFRGTKRIGHLITLLCDWHNLLRRQLAVTQQLRQLQRSVSSLICPRQSTLTGIWKLVQ